MATQPIPVRNPRTGEYDHAIHPPAPAELDALCDRLRAGQQGWAGGGVHARVAAMLAWKGALLARRDEIVDALAHDTGRRGISAMELDLVLGAIDRWCGLAPALLDPGADRTTALPTIRLRQALEPYTLVGVISPWNFPLLLALLDTLPALLAGCAVAVKPSEIAPRFVRPLMRCVEEVPALRDVLAFVEGAGETGSALIDRVDMVCFTGSVPTGRRVAEQAARRFVPANLELGGKDPALVLASADLELASSALVWGSVVNTGHSCLSIERVYAQAPVFDALVERVVDKASRLGLGYPEPDSGPIGPIISAAQARILEDQLRDARERGATVLCGGEIEEHGGGLWIRPTVLVGVDHSMKVMTEETFGPIIPVMPFDGADQGVALANDTEYGLSAAVFAGTEDEALGVAARIQAGAISINDAALTSVMHEGEKNAWKMSGMGAPRMGPAALRRFMRQKAYLIKTQPVPDPWWFPELSAAPAAPPEPAGAARD